MSNFSFVCNCPDAAKSKSFVLNKAGFSYEFNQDWGDSNAGAQNGECKHVWAIKIQLGLVGKDEIPNDVPIDIDEYGNDSESELYGKRPYSGNAFDHENNFTVPDINRYKQSRY